jgi:cytidylate kinase
MGAAVEEKKDGLVIEGSSVLLGAAVRSHGDHRIAMSLAVAALIAKGSTRIDDVSCVGISFPDFFKRLQFVMKPGNRKPGKLPVIAIDGPAGAGKSTIAKMVAKELGFLYIDTGAMYRSVTWKAMRMKADLNDPEALGKIASNIQIVLKQDAAKRSLKVFADGTDVTEAIRNEEVSRHTNAVSSSAPVRKVLRKLQQAIGKNGGVVMEGRDIGTAVFPGAEVKIYLDASPMERAKRRFSELKAKGEKCSLVGIARAIRERDYKDSHRKANPLKKAPDAAVIDSTGMTLEAVCSKIVEIVKKHE